MASNYGINTNITATAARPLSVVSSTPIAVVGTVVLPATAGTLDALVYAEIDAGRPVLFGSALKALAFFAQLAGTMREAIVAIDAQGVQCPLVVSALKITSAEAGVSAETFHGSAMLKSAVVNAVNALGSVASVLGVKPKLLVAPRFSHDLAVSTAMMGTASKLLAMGVVDLNTASENAAVLLRASFGTGRLLLRDPYVKVWDTLANAEKLTPQSASVAGMIAATDGAREYGFADSFSNRVMYGVVGLARAVEFNAGADCEADRLRTASVGTVIRYSGFRTWGGETTDIDPIWTDHTRVRVFDRVSEAALDGLFWAIDRRADVLKSVKDSVEQLLLALKGADVLVGYSVEWDAERNTKANITAGKFYLLANMMNTPIVKRIEVTFNYDDSFGDVLIKTVL